MLETYILPMILITYIAGIVIYTNKAYKNETKELS